MEFDALKKLLEGANNMAQKPQNMSVGEPAQVPEVIEEAATDASLEQINDVAKSPNMKTQPELQQAEMEKKQDRTVAGQLSENAPEKDMMQRMRENISRYEQKVDGPKKEVTWQDQLPDMLAGAHNILNYAQGSQQANINTNSAANAEKRNTAARKEDFGRLQELQKLYSDYQSKTAKKKEDKLTAYQKAELGERKANRELKEKLAKLNKKDKKKSVTKLDEERQKLIAKRFSELETSIPNRKSQITEAKELIDVLKNDELNTGPGSQAAGYVGGFFDTDESSLKQRLDSLAEKAARSQLKANGETRPTDADVEGMKRALFNLGNTEETNIQKLQDFIQQQEAGISEYDQMKEVVDNDGDLEEFKLKEAPIRLPKESSTNEVRRRTKDGKTAIFNAETKEFIRYE